MKSKMVLFILGIALFGGCSTYMYLHRPGNYADAFIVSKDNTEYLKLKGRRLVRATDPVALIMSRTYIDSVLIPLPYERGIILGEDIPVQKGEHKYKGNIQMNGNAISVNLSYSSDDDRIVEQDEWNGDYHLVNYVAKKSDQ